MPESGKLAVFCDFDGTVCRRDVGYHMYLHFTGGRSDELVPLWKRGDLTTRECLLREAAMTQVTPQDFYSFLDQFELSPGFTEFVSLCRANDTGITIVSDGLDIYIQSILSRHGLSDVPVIANAGRLEGGKIVVGFPHDNQSCDRCGSCKGERIREYRKRRGADTVVAFVGDGYSDICATREADVLFAKKDLEEYCRSHDIEYVKYTDFFDVAEHLMAAGYVKRPGNKGENGAV